MNRTTKYKLKHAAVIVAVAAFLLGFVYVTKGSFWMFLGIVAIILFPGRLQAYLWKDYFKGQQFQRRRNHLEAIVHYQRFQKLLKERPERKELIWMTAGIYTRDVEVMNLVNLGVCHLWMSELKDCERCLSSAAKLDPESPLPYFNLSLLFQAKKAYARALKQLDKAEELGFKRSSVEKIRKTLLDDQAEQQALSAEKNQDTPTGGAD